MKQDKTRDYWVGHWGEQAVKFWLQSQGWQVIQERWRSRRGELDLVATQRQQLIFVEVKTRRSHNWDANGLLSITPHKQRRLWQAAEVFLGQFPQYSDYGCRFDLALVSYHGTITEQLTPAQVTQQFTVKDYISGIFT